jgi:chromosome segregation ATPase
MNLNIKQTFQTLERNLEDVKSIYEKDIDKFEENVDKGLKYNESLYDRVEKDVHYLHNDQEVLKKKIISLQKKADELDDQIGNLNY